MPIGSFDLNNYGPSLIEDAAQIAVFYYDPDEEDNPFAIIPNVVCTRIDYREGPEPPVARFRYIFADSTDANLGWPSRVDQVWPIDAQGAYVVQQDDRIVVAQMNPDGSPTYLFDGFAQIPQADIVGGNPGAERASFLAVGVGVRAWDDTIHTRVQRDSDTPDDTSGDSDFEIQAPCRFNPADQRPGSLGGYLKNSTANRIYTIPPTEGDGSSEDTEESDPIGYPVFLDPLLTEREITEDETYLEAWFVSDAMLYLLVQPNPADPYVLWPDEQTISKLLRSLAPPPGTTVFNPKTAVPADCVIRDYDATGKTLPVVMADLVGYAGFYLSWQIGSDGDGLPETSLRFYRRDGASTGTPKQIHLDPPGSSLSQGSISNIVQLHLARDVNRIVNAWRIQTAPKQIEITVLLAPLFKPDALDAQSTNRKQFQSSQLLNATAEVRRKYRWYGGDECGDFHWNMVEGKESVQPLDLSPIFPNTDENLKSYCTRYRPGTDRLVARDSNGRPLKAILEYFSPDDNTYSSDPKLQTEEGADGWKPVKFGWRLLDDRLGIEVTAPDPEEWTTGNPEIPKIAGISQVALAGQQGWPPFTLRLTTTIFADDRIDADAPKRSASPTKFPRWRSIDAEDHFRYCAISPGSVNYPNVSGVDTDPDTKFKIVRDDTDAAKTHSAQLRAAFEMPPLAGAVTMHGIQLDYNIGDKIDRIAGRDISLQTNIGGSQGEAPTYSWVVGLGWIFEPGQYTELHLSDRRAELTPTHHNAY